MRLLGFRPDRESTEPGVIVDGDLFYSTRRGLRSMPSAIDTPMSALVTVEAAYGFTMASGNAHILARASDGVYLSNNGSWLGLTAPTLPKGFFEFGNLTFGFGDSGSLMQRTTEGTGSFSAITGAPAMNIGFATTNGFLITASGRLSGGAIFDDQWASSSIFDHTEWDPAGVNSVASNGRLYFPNGPITAGAALGQQAVLYKRNAIYLGNYVAGSGWLWDGISEQIGCRNREALISAKDAHFFVGSDDVYMFDGTRPVSIGGEIREWLLNNTYRFGVSFYGAFDPRRNLLVWTWFDPFVSRYLGINYSLVTGEWGRCDYNGMLVANTQNMRAAFDNDANLPGFTPGVIVSRNSRFAYTTDDTASSWIETGDFGDEEVEVDVTRIRARWYDTPQEVSGTHYWRDVFSDLPHERSQLVGLKDDKFDTVRKARFHRFRLDMLGSWELTRLNMLPPKKRGHA